MTYSKNIVRLRQERNLSQEEVADAIGVKHLHILIRHQPTVLLTMPMYRKKKKKRKRQVRQAQRKQVHRAQRKKVLQPRLPKRQIQVTVHQVGLRI